MSLSCHINALSASATIDARLEQSLEKHARPPAAETKDELAAKLERLKTEQLSPEERRLKETQENPDQVWPYLNLAEQYRNRSQLEAAEKILRKDRRPIPRSRCWSRPMPMFTSCA